MNTSVAILEAQTETEPIKGIFFDGKKDNKTKTLKFYPDTGRDHSGTKSEEHYTLAKKSAGKYIHYLTPEPLKKKEKPTLTIAEGVHKWIKEHRVEADLMMVSGDSTNTNTGMWRGAIAYLEQLLKHKVHWDICQIK